MHASWASDAESSDAESTPKNTEPEAQLADDPPPTWAAGVARAAVAFAAGMVPVGFSAAIEAPQPTALEPSSMQRVTRFSKRMRRGIPNASARLVPRTKRESWSRVDLARVVRPPQLRSFDQAKP